MADIYELFNISCLLSVIFGDRFDMDIDLLSLFVYYSYMSRGKGRQGEFNTLIYTKLTCTTLYPYYDKIKKYTVNNIVIITF